MKNIYRIFAAGMMAAVLCLGAHAMSGEGTVDKPYLIADADEYAAFAASVNNGTYGADTYAALAADIDFSGKTYPVIGTAAHPYSGHFDGSGHTLGGIRIEKADDAAFNAEGTMAAIGVFGFAVDAHVEDLHVEDMCVTLTGKGVTYRTGLLCGDYSAMSSSADNGFFRCSAQGTISAESEKTVYVGGVVGNLETTADYSTVMISDCEVGVDAKAGAKIVVYGGGAAAKAVEQGLKSTLYITKCVSKMTMESHLVGDRLSHEYVGGMIGFYSIVSDWTKANDASLSAEEMRLSGCVTTLFDVTNAITTAHCADIAGYLNYEGGSLKPVCYTETNSRYSSDSSGISGRAATAVQLADEAFWTGLGYDLTDVWEMTDDGIMLQKAPAPEEPEPIVLSYAEGVLKAEIRLKNAPAGTLITALYDADGRMTDVMTAEITAETIMPVCLETSAEAMPAAVRVFVLDAEAFSPLCEVIAA